MKLTDALGRLRFAPLVVVAASWIPHSAFGQGGIPGYPNSIYSFDPREIRMLPSYCIYTPHYREQVQGGNNPTEINRWSQLMGQTFGDMHHYCYALMNFNRATLLAREEHVRRHYLQVTINEIDYVLKDAPKNFILLPEMLTKKGEVFVKQGRAPLAIEQFERAIELKPDYWPPYAHLSDIYKAGGDLPKARQSLEAGLTHAPDARGLQRRLAELEKASDGRKGGPVSAHK